MESPVPAPERIGINPPEDLQEKSGESELESVRSREADVREADLLLERIRQLPDKPMEGDDAPGENAVEHRNETLDALNQSLDDLFGIAESRSGRASGFREELNLLARTPRDFFVETRALALLRQSKENLKQALTSQEDREAAIRVLNRVLNGMAENENIETCYAHNSGIEKKLRNLGVEMLLDNQDIVLESLDDPSPMVEETIGKILSGAVEHHYGSSGRPSGSDQEINALSVSLLPVIRQRIEVLKEDPMTASARLERYAVALRPTLLGGDQEQAALARQAWCEALLAVRAPMKLQGILENHVYSYGNNSQQMKEAVSGLVARMGLDPEKFYDADKNRKGDSERNYVKNILAAQFLESRSPGSVKKLAEEYGIRSFARYPTQILLRQLETEGDLESPYGIVLNPREDWNGGFYDDRHLFDVFSDSAQAEGVNVRIFECESKMDVAKKLIRLNRTYGAEQKIQFALVGGHGNKELLRLGEGERILQKKDLAGRAMEELRNFFGEDATIVLNSCSTGDDFGIGETMSRLDHIDVVAPDRPTSMRTLQVKQQEGKCIVSVEYRPGEDGQNVLRRYEKGKLVIGERGEEFRELEKLLEDYL